MNLYSLIIHLFWNESRFNRFTGKVIFIITVNRTFIYGTMLL